MAKGPRRFVVAFTTATVLFTGVGQAILMMRRASADGTTGISWSELLIQSVVATLVCTWIGVGQWRNGNRVYAEKTGDPTALYWSNHYFVPPLVPLQWVAVALSVLVTLLAIVMAMASGTPLLWATAIATAAVGVVLVAFMVRAARRPR